MESILSQPIVEHTTGEGDRGFDVIVYGATAGGVLAAIAAARAGVPVALLEPGQHVGGVVSGKAGTVGTSDASSCASQGAIAQRDVLGRSTIQLLYRSCESELGERAAADASNGGGHDGSLLECGGVALAAGSATALDTAETAREALQGDADID